MRSRARQFSAWAFVPSVPAPPEVVRSGADCGLTASDGQSEGPSWNPASTFPLPLQGKFSLGACDGKRTFALVVRRADTGDYSAVAVLRPLKQTLRLARTDIIRIPGRRHRGFPPGKLSKVIANASNRGSVAQFLVADQDLPMRLRLNAFCAVTASDFIIRSGNHVCRV